MVDCVVLDLGEVVLRLDFGPLLRHLGLDDTMTLAQGLKTLDRWELYDRFERGDLTEEAFLAALSERSARPLATPELLRVWNSVIVGPVTGVESLLEQLAARVPLYALTNTNPIHLRHVTAAYPWLRAFRKIFSSTELKARKPEPLIFDRMVRDIGIAPERILFVDDRPDNVEGARRAGLQSEICRRSPEDLLEILTRHRLL